MTRAPIIMQDVHGSAWTNHQPVILRALRSGSMRTVDLASECGVTVNAAAFTRALRKLVEQGKIMKTGGGKDERGRQVPIAYELTAKGEQ